MDQAVTQDEYFNDSSSDGQYVDDVEYFEDEHNDQNDECYVLDEEEKKIDELTKNMNTIKEQLFKFDGESLENIYLIKANVYLLCENHRYIIDDSKFLENLENIINERINHYEDKLFQLSEKLVDEEENKIKIYDTNELNSIEKINNDDRYRGRFDKSRFDKSRFDDSQNNKLNNNNIDYFKHYLAENESNNVYNSKDHKTQNITLKSKSKKSKIKIINSDELELKEVKFVYRETKKSKKSKYDLKFLDESENIKDLDSPEELNIITKTKELKDVDELTDLNKLKEEYYRRMDLIIEQGGSLSDKLLNADQIDLFEIKKKIVLLENQKL